MQCVISKNWLDLGDDIMLGLGLDLGLRLLRFALSEFSSMLYLWVVLYWFKLGHFLPLNFDLFVQKLQSDCARTKCVTNLVTAVSVYVKLLCIKTQKKKIIWPRDLHLWPFVPKSRPCQISWGSSCVRNLVKFIAFSYVW